MCLHPILELGKSFTDMLKILPFQGDQLLDPKNVGQWNMLTMNKSLSFTWL